MIRTAIKLRKQVVGNCNCFLLLENIKNNQTCVNNVLFELSRYETPINKSDNSLLNSSTHIEGEILLYLDSEYESTPPPVTDQTLVNVKTNIREAETKIREVETKIREAETRVLDSELSYFSYKNRNIYNPTHNID